MKVASVLLTSLLAAYSAGALTTSVCYMASPHRSSLAILTRDMIRPIITAKSYLNTLTSWEKYSTKSLSHLHSSRRKVALRAAPSCINIVSPEDLSNVKHWFTLSLPEGTCVGVTTSPQYNSLDHGEANTLPLPSALHIEEFDWGKENISSDTSRSTFYLGRIALRSSLHDVLNDHNDEKVHQYWKKIERHPIRKDNFGRPILPNAIVGSISHKKDYAVGLGRLRYEGIPSSLIDDQSMNLHWREECPIFPDKDDTYAFNGESKLEHDKSFLVGIGVDIEIINDKRSERIQRKVLTEREQSELGALKVMTFFNYYANLLCYNSDYLSITDYWHFKTRRSYAKIQVNSIHYSIYATLIIVLL